MTDILTPDRVINRLVTQAVFADLDPVSLRVIALASERWNLDPGDDLFMEGEPSDSAYFVLEGAFALTSGETQDSLAVSGDLIHPLALIADLDRPMTATAQTPCDILKIPRTVFLRILESAPALAIRLRDKLSREFVAQGSELRAIEQIYAD